MSPEELAAREAAELASRLTGGRPAPDRPAAADGLLRPGAGDQERLEEGALRPRMLDEFVGQERVREQLSIVLEGAKRRGRPP